MNYSILLNGYNCLPISINKDLLNLGSNNIDSILPKDIELLLNSLGLDIYNQNLVYINVTKEGIVFNYDRLIKVLSNYFNIPINKKFENTINSFRSRLKTTNGLSTLPVNIRQECDDYSNHIMFSKYKEPNVHTSTPVREQTLTDMAIEKAKAIDLYKKYIEKKLNIFEKLVINEEDYKRVTIDFDQDKLNLYLAFIVKDYADKFKNKNKIKEYKFALKYIYDYLNNNKELLDNNFQVSKYDFNDTYSIDSLKEYLESLNLEDNNISIDKTIIKHI